MDELLAQFRVEAPELAQQAEADLLALERDGGDRAALDGAFRAIHTLKGAVALFDMAPLGEALHAAEDWLGELRAGRLALHAADLDAVLALLGDSEDWLAHVRPDGSLPPEALQSCLRMAERLGRAGGEAAGGEPPVDAGVFGDRPPTPPWALALLAAHADDGAKDAPRVAVRYTPDADAYFRGDDPLALMARTPGLIALEIAPREPFGDPALYDPFRCNLRLTALAHATPDEVRGVFRLAGAQVEVAAIRNSAGPESVEPLAERSRDGAARRLRVEPERVDALMELADALTAASSALGALPAEGPHGPGLAAHRQQIARLVAELHAAVTRVRLAPLSRTFERLPRLVRELSARLGKPVRLEVEGEALEADRVVVDALFEPLLHLLRNALDHGLEAPADRRAAGKPAEGRVRLRARQQGHELHLEVQDDGRGVDVEAVRRAAAAKGLHDPAALTAMDDADVLGLLFAAGMSTTRTVSEVSGRGVGMDAVKQGVEGLGGSVSLASAVGRGTTVALRLPVSAVLTRLITVRVGPELYGAPMSALVETARLTRDRVEAVGSGSATVWRGRTLPIVHLHDLVGVARGEAGDELRLLIVDSGGGDHIGLVVEAFAGRVEGVLRPLSGLLAGLPGVLGTTLTPDGAVLFVLDLAALVR